MALPVQLWEDLTIGGRNDEALKSLLAELEFNSVGKRIFGKDFAAGRGHEPPINDSPDDSPNAVTLKTIKDVKHDYQLVNSVNGLHALAQKLSLAERVCFDLETTSLDPRSCEILGIAFSLTAHEAYFLHTGPGSAISIQMALEKLAVIFQSKHEKIGHNLKFDLSVLLAHDFKVSGPFFDTMLVHAIVSPEQRHNMDFISEAMLGYTPVKLTELAEKAKEPENDLFALDEPKEKPKKKRKKKELNMKMIPIEDLAEYAAEDADITFQLADKLRLSLQESDQIDVYQNIEQPLLPEIGRAHV